MEEPDPQRARALRPGGGETQAQAHAGQPCLSLYSILSFSYSSMHFVTLKAKKQSHILSAIKGETNEREKRDSCGGCIS